MKLPLRVSEESKEPIYHQIETQIKAMILGGQLPPGAMIPSIRTLSHDLACSVITTRRAYQNLENEGYIATVQGKGTFVAKVAAADAAEVKYKLISQGFVRTAEQAKQTGCSREEAAMLFQQALDEVYEGRKSSPDQGGEGEDGG